MCQKDGTSEGLFLPENYYKSMMLPVPLTSPRSLLKCNAALLPVVPVTGGASPGSLLPCHLQDLLFFFLIVKNPNLISEIIFFSTRAP